MTDRATAPAPTAPGPGRTGALLTVTGADRPGVTATLFAALQDAASEPLEVVDVEPVVVHG